MEDGRTSALLLGKRQRDSSADDESPTTSPHHPPPPSSSLFIYYCPPVCMISQVGRRVAAPIDRFPSLFVQVGVCVCVFFASESRNTNTTYISQHQTHNTLCFLCLVSSCFFILFYFSFFLLSSLLLFCLVAHSSSIPSSPCSQCSPAAIQQKH